MDKYEVDLYQRVYIIWFGQRYFCTVESGPLFGRSGYLKHTEQWCFLVAAGAANCVAGIDNFTCCSSLDNHLSVKLRFTVE